MKILFIAPGLPVDYGSGSAMRSYQLYKELQKHSEVDVLSATNWPISPEELKEFDGNYIGHIKINAHPSLIRKTPSLSDKLTKAVNLEDYNYIFVRYYNQAYWLGLFDLDNLILDCDDCFLEVLENEYRDEIRGKLLRLKSYISHHLIKNNYLTALRRAKTLIFSRHSIHSRLLPNAYEIPNKLSSPQRSIAHYRAPESSQINILFIGVLNYRPNVDGINHFLKHIWPRVTEEHKNAVFVIAGARAKERSKRRWKTHPNVDMQGYVADIEDAYKKADICIVPVYRGGGVHIKIMEAFKYGKPVVMSSESQRGYHNSIKDAETAFVAESDNDFVNKLDMLIRDSTLRESMSARGNEVFLQSYCIDSDDPTIKTILSSSI